MWWYVEICGWFMPLSELESLFLEKAVAEDMRFIQYNWPPDSVEVYTYRLDLLWMTQTNLHTETVRHLIRIAEPSDTSPYRVLLR